MASEEMQAAITEWQDNYNAAAAVRQTELVDLRKRNVALGECLEQALLFLQGAAPLLSESQHAGAFRSTVASMLRVVREAR